MTTPRQCSVLLLKAADAKYEDAFQSESLSTSGDTSFDVHFADVLTFEYVKADALRDVLLRLDDYSAILVTSPRAGIAVRNVISSLEDEVLRERVVEALRATAVFSVGKATSRELECLGVDCRGDHCGSAEVMAEYIHQDGILPVTAATKPVVFLCGDKRRDTLPDSFHERGKPLVELCVYRTCAVSDFQLPDACQTPDWVVFFSPSGIKATRSVAVAWETVRKAAIGKTTAAALEKEAEETGEPSWAADVVAPQPTAEAVAQEIAKFEQRAGPRLPTENDRPKPTAVVGITKQPPSRTCSGRW